MPFGVTKMVSGYNFALFSKNATAVSLLLYFDNQSIPDHEIPLHPIQNHTGDVWHILVDDLPDGFYYMYRVDGPWQPEFGHIFNREQLLLDPYAKGISGLEIWGERDACLEQYLGYVEPVDYDWGDDSPPSIPLSDSIIYELHVRGFSRHSSSGVSHPGTYHAIVEKIDYLKSLGVTAVELMPVQEFDETECRYTNPESKKQLLNYWGYSTIGFFALKTAFAASDVSSGAIREFRDMVRALHAEGLEIILDVVFNHTAEGDKSCPVISFKGIENSTYYILDHTGDYQNFSGCGNTLNCNHPVVHNMILDALRYWVIEMHVDGFRFDLASILTRDENGQVLDNPPLLEAIAKDPVLSHVKLIAEAWDATGLYQVGSFPASRRWAEWNGRYRDSTRRFIRGEPGLTAEMATRISGSEDLYQHSGRSPYHSINFITAHDGFTMMDLVSYTKKHNNLNGQDNADGESQNFSLNFGVEGETDDRAILSKRRQQVRNMATILMLSQGTPMILAGDEFGNSQSGNNNAWCQDNSISWLDWKLLDLNWDLFAFWKKLIEFRKKHRSLHRKRFFTGKINNSSGIADISWHNVKQGEPGFNTPTKSLAYLIDDVASGSVLFVMANFNEDAIEFEVPSLTNAKPWRQILSTHDPEGFIDDAYQTLPSAQKTIQVAAFSISVLIREVH